MIVSEIVVCLWALVRRDTVRYLFWLWLKYFNHADIKARLYGALGSQVLAQGLTDCRCLWRLVKDSVIDDMQTKKWKKLFCQNVATRLTIFYMYKWKYQHLVIAVDNTNSFLWSAQQSVTKTQFVFIIAQSGVIHFFHLPCTLLYKYI